MLGSIGRQKFTKALILSGGATVVEVDVGHAARQGASRYSPLRLTRLALHVLAGFWPQPIQWAGVVLGFVCTLAAAALGIYGVVVLDQRVGLPRPAASSARRVIFVLGVQGFILALVGEYLGRIQREVEGRPCTRRPRAVTKPCGHPVPAARAPDSEAAVREPSCRHVDRRERVLVTGGAGFISVERDPPPARAHRRTRSSRSTRSPTPATSRTSPT